MRWRIYGYARVHCLVDSPWSVTEYTADQTKHNCPCNDNGNLQGRFQRGLGDVDSSDSTRPQEIMNTKHGDGDAVMSDIVDPYS